MSDQFSKTLEILNQLIAFDTTSRNSNMELIDYVSDYLGQWNIEPLVIHNEDRTKANLYATIGPDVAGGIVLSGHTDVVPIDGQPWTTEPFRLTQKDGKLFGRGTSDMKSFVALCLAYVPRFMERPLRRPIHLAFSHDEEVGCVGVGSMIERIVNHLPMPEIVIVGEPSDMKVVNRHKGIRTFVTSITGREAHSSKQNLGANAITAASQLIEYLGELSLEMQAPDLQDAAFDPPYTTINVGTIKGGNAINIIPRECKFGWEYRCMPGVDELAILTKFEAFAEQTVLPDLRKKAPDAAIETKCYSVVPVFNVSDGSPAESLVLALAEQNETHAVSYTTEAGLFEGAGLNTVVCGPGSIEQAHKPDEFIEIEQIKLGLRFMDRLCNHVHTQTSQPNPT